MSKVSMTVQQIKDLGLWDKVSEYLGINPWALNEGQIDNDEVLEFDTEFKKEVRAETIETSWMRFKATKFTNEDGEEIVKLDLQDYSDFSGFTFYKNELDDVIKVLEFLKDKISE